MRAGLLFSLKSLTVVLVQHQLQGSPLRTVVGGPDRPQYEVQQIHESPSPRPAAAATPPATEEARATGDNRPQLVLEKHKGSCVGSSSSPMAADSFSFFVVNKTGLRNAARLRGSERRRSLSVPTDKVPDDVVVVHRRPEDPRRGDTRPDKERDAVVGRQPVLLRSRFEAAEAIFVQDKEALFREPSFVPFALAVVKKASEDSLDSRLQLLQEQKPERVTENRNEVLWSRDDWFRAEKEKDFLLDAIIDAKCEQRRSERARVIAHCLGKTVPQCVQPEIQHALGVQDRAAEDDEPPRADLVKYLPHEVLKALPPAIHKARFALSAAHAKYLTAQWLDSNLQFVQERILNAVCGVPTGGQSGPAELRDATIASLAERGETLVEQTEGHFSGEGEAGKNRIRLTFFFPDSGFPRAPAWYDGDIRKKTCPRVFDAGLGKEAAGERPRRRECLHDGYPVRKISHVLQDAGGIIGVLGKTAGSFAAHRAVCRGRTLCLNSNVKTKTTCECENLSSRSGKNCSRHLPQSCCRMPIGEPSPRGCGYYWYSRSEVCCLD